MLSLIFQQLVYVHSRIFSPWRRLSSRSCDRVASESRGHQRCDPLPNQRPSLPARTPMAKWRNGEGMASLPAGDPEAKNVVLGGSSRYHQISDIITGWWLTNHLEKYDFVNGKDDISYMKWKIKKFETTNQIRFFGLRRSSDTSILLSNPSKQIRKR